MTHTFCRLLRFIRLSQLGVAKDPAAEIEKGITLFSRPLIVNGEPIHIYRLKKHLQAILQKFGEACAVIPQLQQYERRITMII